MDDFSNGVITDASEFGAVDNPALGGYTEPNWNVGAWGDNIASTEDQGIALPESVLRQYGNPRHPDFGKSFNQNYQVDLIHPETGEPVLQDVPLRDLGPSPRTGKGIDMMYATARAMGQDLRGGGQVGFRITPRAQPVEQQENVPQGTNAGQPPPSWQDVENSQEFQGISQDQKLQVLDAWHKQVYGYANQIGGFDEQSRGDLYDFYNQKKQDLQPKPYGPVEFAQDIGKAWQQYQANTAKGAAQSVSQASPEEAAAIAKAASGTLSPAGQEAYAQTQSQVQSERQPQATQEVKQQEQNLQELSRGRQPNQVAQTIAQIGAFAPSALIPGVGMLAGASQMQSAAYSQAYDDAKQAIEQYHPHWNPDQKEAIAQQVATQSAQAAFQQGILLGGGISVPLRGIVQRTLANAGLVGVEQAALSGYGQHAENLAQMQVNPKTTEWQGVPEAVAAGSALGATVGGVHGAFTKAERPTPNQVERPKVDSINRPTVPQEPVTRPVRAEEILGKPEPTSPEEESTPQIVQRGAGKAVRGPGITWNREAYVPPAVAEAGLAREEPSPQQIQAPRTPVRVVDLQSVAQNLSPQGQRILSLVPHDVNIVQGQDTNWNPDSRTITLRDPGNATDLVHEAVHAVMQDNADHPAVINAWRNFVSQAKNINKLPSEFHYALQSPEEHMAAALSDPGYQKLIGKKGMKDISTAVDQVLNGEPARPGLMPTEGVTEQPVPVQSALSLQGAAPGNARELPFKKNWKPSLDILHDYQGTQDLWSRAQNWNALKGLRQGEVNKVEDLYKQLLKSNKELPSRIHTIGQLYMQGRPVNPSADEAAFIKAAGDLLTQQYQQAAGMGVKIAPPKFPGMIRRDYLQKLLSPLEKDGQPTANGRELFLTGQNNGSWSSWQEFKQFADQYRKVYANEYQGLRASPLESPVTAPEWMQTHSADAIMQVLRNNAEALARTEAFGPNQFKGRAAFQQAVDAISRDPSLIQDQRSNAQAAIQHVKNTVEGTLPMPGKTGKALKSATTLSMASGPMTAFGRILPSELLRTFGQHGPFREAASMVKTATAWKDTNDMMRRLDLSMQARRGMINDLYSDQGPWNTGKVMRAGMFLHSAVQNFGRKVAALSARTQLEKDLIPALEQGPQSAGYKFAQQEISRRGLNPQDFVNPNVSQELRDAYVRNTVLDTQTSFDPLKSPMWGSKSSIGQYAMQFGHWPQEAARGLLRETLNPLARSWSSGDYATAGRYLTRLMWTALAAPLGSEAINAVRTGIFGKQDENATWSEIWGMMLKHSPYTANALLQRLGNDVIAGPIWGTFGDVASAANNFAHGNWQQSIAWDPTHPAVLGVMSGLGQLVQRATQEKHIPSMKEIRDALRQSAAGPVQTWNAYEHLGGPTPWSYMDKGYQDRDFARRSYTLWQKLTGQPLQPRQQDVTAGLRTPYYNDISDALYSGDAKAARTVMQRMMQEQGESLKKAGTEIAAAIHARAPIPQQNHKAFLQSAPEILDPQEVQRMQRIQSRYYGTAISAGLLQRAPK